MTEDASGAPHSGIRPDKTTACNEDRVGPTELHRQSASGFLCWPMNVLDLCKNDKDLPEAVERLAEFIARWEQKGRSSPLTPEQTPNPECGPVDVREMLKPVMWVCLVDAEMAGEKHIRAWTSRADRAQRFKEDGLDMRALYVAPPANRIEQEGGMREALKTAKSCIEDLGSGKGGWAWEEVLTQIEAALAAKPTAGVCACTQPGGDPLGNCEVCATRPPSLPGREALHEALNAIQAQCDAMRSLKGWRLNLIRENLAKAKAALTVPVREVCATCGEPWIDGTPCDRKDGLEADCRLSLTKGTGEASECACVKPGGDPLGNCAVCAALTPVTDVGREQQDHDIGMLLSALRYHEEAVGEKFDDCGGIIAQIEADHKARQPALISRALSRTPSND